MNSIRHSFMQQVDAHAAGVATVARTVEHRAERGRGAGRHGTGPGVGSPGVCRRGAGRHGTEPGVGRCGAGRHGTEPGVGRCGDKPPPQRNGEAYAMRRMAKTNAKTNVTSIITAPEKRKTSDSSITRLSA